MNNFEYYYSTNGNKIKHKFQYNEKIVNIHLYNCKFVYFIEKKGITHKYLIGDFVN